MMPTFPSHPPKIPYGGFSPVRLQGWCISTAPSREWRPPCRAFPVCIHCLRAHRFQLFVLRSVSCSCVLKHYHSAATPLYPSGPSSRPGSAVPVHPHLCGPIRPARRAQRVGAYTPPPSLYVSARRPTTGSVLSLRILSQHVALYDSGSRRRHAPSSFPANDGLRRFSADSGLPSVPQIRITWGHLSELH